MFVKVMHPRTPHQLWEVPAGQTVKFGVIAPVVGSEDSSDPNWSWTPLLHAHGVPAMEVWVTGDPDVYADGDGKHYFVKYATWWDQVKCVDVAVITGTDGDIYLMSDRGSTIDKVG